MLEGPNLYFPRPAIKLTLSVGPWIAADEDRFAAAAERARVNLRPGKPGSEQRRRAIARLASQLTKRLARATDVRLAVRSRPGPEPEQIVVAFPWRRRGSAEAAAREVAPLLDAIGGRRSVDRLVAEAAERIAAVEPGPEPSVPEPSIPVISVTGTNGKTTTVRLLAHLVRSAGLTVAYSSTDGVYRGDGELVEAGDYSGFAGAATALAQEPDVAVLETARGGILLRGIGVLRNEVAVVTNVSADHLGLHGIRTVDQLAEVKATITRITRSGRLGRPERRRPPRPVDASRSHRPPVALLDGPRPSRDPRDARGGRSGDGPARRLDDGARRLQGPGARAARSTCPSRSRACRVTT